MGDNSFYTVNFFSENVRKWLDLFQSFVQLFGTYQDSKG